MENFQPSFDTVVEALNWLYGRGFTQNFNLEENCIRLNREQTLSPDEFSIEYVFRFEGDTDPGDEEIVYGIASENHSLKGVLTSAYGTYADSLSAEMIKKLTIHY